MTVDKKEEKWERTEQPQWYAVHTYSGYENKVKVDLEKAIENRGLQDQMLQVVVPMQEVEGLQPVRKKKKSEEVQIDTDKNQKKFEKKNSLKKLFPGYVLIQMYMTDDTWYVVRNTRGVTGFVGPDSKPVPLSQKEVDSIFAAVKVRAILYSVGELVEVTAPGFEGTIAAVESVDEDRERLTIRLDTPGQIAAEFSFSDVKRVEEF